MTKERLAVLREKAVALEAARARIAVRGIFIVDVCFRKKCKLGLSTGTRVAAMTLSCVSCCLCAKSERDLSRSESTMMTWYGATPYKAKTVLRDLVGSQRHMDDEQNLT